MSYKSDIPADERAKQAKAIQDGGQEAPGAKVQKAESNRRILDVVFIVLLIANLVVEFI